jgi:hypothetical protein
MGDYSMQKATSAAAEWDGCALVIWADLQANPGSTLAQVAGRIGQTTTVTKRVLASIDRSGGLYRGHDINGAEFLWDLPTLATLVIARLQDALVWLSTHDGHTVSAMATALGVHFAVATKMAFMLQAEADVKLTPL